MSKKKIIIIASISVILLVLAIGLSVFLYFFNKTNEKEDLAGFYEKILYMDTYSVSLTIDNHIEFYAKTDDMAFLSSKLPEDTYSYDRIIKDRKTYILDHERKTFDEINNVSELLKIQIEVDAIAGNAYVEGKEFIDGKIYEYDEYEKTSTLAFNKDFEGAFETAKTRFYFDENGNWVYMKTITETHEELIKVEFKEEVDTNIFEIPSDYDQEVYEENIEE